MKKSNSHGIVRTHRPKLIAIIRLFDVAIIGFSLYYLLEFYGLEFNYYPLWLFLIASMVFEFCTELNLLYIAPRGTSLFSETQKTFGSWLGVAILLVLIVKIHPILITGYETVFWNWLFLVPIELIIWHFFTRSVINYGRSLGRNTRQVAIIGATDLGSELEYIIRNESWLGFLFVGYFDDRLSKDQGRAKQFNQELSGNIDKLIEMVNDHKIDVIYITLPLQSEKRIKQIIVALTNTTAAVYYVPDLFGFDLLRSKMENLSGIPVISIHDTPFYGVDGFYKRFFDIVISVLILMIVSIPCLLIAAVVKITSPGPVLFKQRRYGFNGDEITIWKFRSMTVSENDEAVKQATKNDMRVTKFGNFIRKTSLDELPQFINVLQGRMSIIGPRPHAVVHNEFYRGQVHGYMLRHKVKPGITGLAQISGCRGETDTIDKMDNRIQYDLEYIRNWSLMLDFKILLKTILKGFTDKQAY